MPVVNKELQKQYAEVHTVDSYGRASSRFALHIQACVCDLAAKSILDYGCGQSDLSQSLELRGAAFYRYDPAIESISAVPVASVDLISNTDVMEHIPRSDVEHVLRHMKAISEHVFFNIATRSASQLLPNGSNAHCTVLPADEWLALICKVFPNSQLVADYPGHSCVIITWNSSVLPVLAGIERLRQAESQRNEYQQPVIRRLRRTARRVVDRMANRQPSIPVIYPATTSKQTN